MRLITTNEDLKLHNSSVTLNLSVDSLQTFLDDAENNHIIPAIGRATFNEITNTVAEVNSPRENLLKFLQKAAVNFAVGNYISYGSVQLSDSGAHVQSGESLKPASDKKIIALRKQSFADAYTALENAVRFLHDEQEVFITYKNSEEHKQNCDRFINHSIEFTRACSDIVSAQLFNSLKGEIMTVELDSIEPLLGETLTEHLRGQVLAGTPTDIEKKLLRKIQRAVAPLALAGIIPYRSISIDSEGIFQLSETVGGISGNVENRNPAEDRKLQSAMMKYCTRGEAELEDLRRWLNTNKELFTGYTESELGSMSKVAGSDGIYFM